MEKNLTTGSVFKTIVSFSLPFLLSYFLQTLYGMADLFIIGQFYGVDSTTAVSIGSQVMHMLTVMIVGLAMGSTVLIGRAVGAGDSKQASLAVGNTAVLFLSLSVLGAVLLLWAAEPIVSLMSTPAEAASGTARYLTICFLGIPFITAYNIISSIFRGMGDSKSPMYFVAVACAFNIGLDYLFIGGCGLGTAGAALGTTLSQTISVAVSLFIVQKRGMIPGICAADFKPQKKMMGGILKIGVAASVLMQFAAEGAVGLFTAQEEAVRLGGQYMRGYVWDCIFAGIHFCFSGYFCAYGRAGISFVHNLASILCARIPLAYLASRYFLDSLFPMGLAAPTGSLLSVIICIGAFVWMEKQNRMGALHGEGLL